MKEGWLAGGRTRLNLLCTYKPRAKRGRVYSRDRSALVRICESRCFAAQLLARRDDRGKVRVPAENPELYSDVASNPGHTTGRRCERCWRNSCIVSKEDGGNANMQHPFECGANGTAADGLDVLRFRHPPPGTASPTRIFQE